MSDILYPPKIVCSNDLCSGRAVWLTPDQTWSPDVNHAHLLTQKQLLDQLMEWGKTQSHHVMAPWSVAAEKNHQGHVVPLVKRERVRSGKTPVIQKACQDHENSFWTNKG